VHYPVKRREFLRFFFGSLTAIWAGGMLWALKNFFFFRPGSSGIALGSYASYATGSVTHDERNRILVCRDDGGLFVMSDTCTHRSCMLRLEKNRLLCPCHSAEFDFHGMPIRGPAERPLDCYYIYKNRENILTADPARTVARAFRYTG
jgi:Rieske Fe-S protein